jgi:hypothetical protein
MRESSFRARTGQSGDREAGRIYEDCLSPMSKYITAVKDTKHKLYLDPANDKMKSVAKDKMKN